MNNKKTLFSNFLSLSLNQKFLRLGIVIYAISAVTSITGMAFGLVLGLIGSIIYIISKSKLITKERNITVISLLIVIFAIITFISTILSVNPLSSFYRYRSFLGELAMFFIILYASENDPENNFRKKVIEIIIIFAIIESIYGIVQYLTGIDPLRIEKSTPFSPIQRIRGTLGHWNALGGMLGMVYPLCLAVIYYYFRIKNKTFYFYIFGISVISICLILTFTRGAWLGVICGLIIMGISKNKKLLIFPLIFILLIFLVPQSRNRIINSIKKPDIERMFVWESTIDMIKKKPIFGWGQDTFQNEFYTHYTTNLKARKILDEFGKRVFDVRGIHFHTHNVYIGLIQETGIFGLIVFLTILFTIFKRIILILKNNFNFWEKTLTWGILGVIVDFSVHGLLDYPLRAETAYMFWFLAGLLFSFDKKNVINKGNSH